jgi:hypothetical protein
MRRLVLLLACLAFTVSCGGGADVGGGAAEVVPESTVVFLSMNTDFDGEQWQTAADLVRKFPDGERAIQSLLQDFEQEVSADFEQDVRPALGPEVGVAVLGFGEGGEEPAVVALTQPEDQQKLRQLLEESDEPTVTEEVAGWTLFAETQEAIDEFKRAREEGTLDGSDDFADAMDGLDADALLKAYVNGERAQEAAEADPEAAQGLQAILPGGQIPSIGAVLVAEGDGARFDGQALFADDPVESGYVSEPYEAQLPEVVPGGVLAYVSFNDLEGQFSNVRDGLSEAQPEFDRQLAQVEGLLGLSIEEDLAPLFAGEGAFYVRQGAPIPEITLLLEVEDEAKARQTLDDLVEGLRQFAPVPPAEEVEVAGVELRQITISPPFSLLYGTFDGKLVLTTTRGAVEALREEGDRFADDEAFQEAAEQAGLPDETSGFGYVDAQEVVRLILGFAEASDSGEVPSDVRENLEPLKSLVFYQTEDESTVTFSAFLAIE